MGSWHEYYSGAFNEKFITFGTNRAAYLYALENLRMRQGDDVLPAGQATFVLGGVHPKADSAAEFLRYCKQVHPGVPEDRYVIMDQNEEALRDLSIEEGVRLLGSLEVMHQFFPQGSIDLMALDLTLNFMQDQQIQRFAQSAETVLKPDGLVMAVVNDVTFPRLASYIQSKKNRVPYYARRVNDFLTLTEPHLKPVEIGHFITQMGVTRASHAMLVFSRQGSAYERVEDESIAYDFRWREFLRRAGQR